MNKITLPEWRPGEPDYDWEVIRDSIVQLIANQNELISRWEAIDEWESPMHERLEAICKQLDRHDEQIGYIKPKVKQNTAWIGNEILKGGGRVVKPEGYWECPVHGRLQPHEVREKLCRVRVGDWACQREATWRTDKPSEVLSDSELKELIGGIGASVPAGNPDLCPICGGEISMRKTPRAWAGCIPCNWNWYGESIEQWKRMVTRGS